MTFKDYMAHYKQMHAALERMADYDWPGHLVDDNERLSWCIDLAIAALQGEANE